jgi:outer membrane lipoprotein-sorting protein
MTRLLYLIIWLISMTLTNASNAAPVSSVKLVEDYLNSFNSLKIEFLQLDNDARERSGTLYIAKPSRMRLVYHTNPAEVFIMKNKLLMHRDPAIKESNYLPADQAVLSFLTQKRFSFAKQAQILEIEDSVNTINVKFKLRDDAQHTLILTFNKHPIRLRTITLQDEDDIMIIEVVKIAKNPKLSVDLFDFNNF